MAWWSFPGSGEAPEAPPLAAAAPGTRRVPVPVNPADGLVRVEVAEAPEEPVAAQEPGGDTGVVVLELVLPVGEGCEGLTDNVERLEGLLEDVKSAQGMARKHILRQLGPLMQSVEVDGCDPVPDHRPEVTRVLCDELRERPDDMELMLVTGFAEVTCD